MNVSNTLFAAALLSLFQPVLSAGSNPLELERLDAALAKEPGSVALLSRRGDELLFQGRFDEAVRDFERTIAIDPAQDVRHWRLGIAYYFAGKYEQSARQFAKYHAYDGRDRENGIWKYMADVRASGRQRARESMLTYTQFDREPFPSLYEMFAGKKAPDEVLTELKAKGLPNDGAPTFFGRYYTGVNEALAGNLPRACELVEAAVNNPWGQRAEGGGAYMWRVAKLHLMQLKIALAKADPPARKLATE